jgi:hypothetical protein
MRLAIDCTPLRNAVHEADATGDVTELLKIRRNKEIRRYLAILEVEERPDLPASELAVAEISKEARIAVMTTETGLTLEDVVTGNVPWSPEDMAKFREFGKEMWLITRLGLCGLKMQHALEAILARPVREHLPR